jgi:hypothetical protein
MTYGWDYLVDIIHTPITVSPPLVPVNAAAVIKSPHKIAKNINGPRLYYKVNNGSMNFVNYNYYNLDTFKFTIPGQSAGSSVKYYIAAQDSLGRFIATKPSRGRGINPPGTVEPDSLISYSVITGIASNNRNLKYSLEQNYPNPFNITTTINYHLANNSNVSLKVFDITGKEIAVLVNKKQNTGNHKVEWDASQFSSGVYFYKLTTDNYIDTKKMLMIK